MRVLVGFIWDGKSGGIDAYLMAFARVARDEGVNLDFLTNDYCEELALELEDMGHRLFEIATLHDRASQRRTIRLLCGQNSYDAAYFNISTALMYPVVKDARDAGVPKIAVHSHATGSNQESNVRELLFNAANTVLRGRLRRCATHKFACSEDSARWLFGEGCEPAGRVLFVPNPVDSDKFAYDARVRTSVREELGLEDRFVVGSVTAMRKVKNPWLLVDAFAVFARNRHNAHLLVVGGGNLLSELEGYAARVLKPGSYSLLGKRQDVSELLQAFDVFVLTSKREGMPISVLEAQVAGLPCLLSHGAAGSAVLEGADVFVMREAASSEEWAARLEELALSFDARERRPFFAEARRAGFCSSSPKAVLDRLRD